MIDWTKVETLAYEDRLPVLLGMIRSQWASEDDVTCNLANTAAILYHGLDDVSWVGFYLYDGQELVLGPFQGLAACNRILPPNGVCGTAFSEQRGITVPDVEEFPGHIACDGRTRSEIVYPIHLKNGTMGVLDIDSTTFHRFKTPEERFVQQVAGILSQRS